MYFNSVFPSAFVWSSLGGAGFPIIWWFSCTVHIEMSHACFFSILSKTWIDCLGLSEGSCWVFWFVLVFCLKDHSAPMDVPWRRHLCFVSKNCVFLKLILTFEIACIWIKITCRRSHVFIISCTLLAFLYIWFSTRYLCLCSLKHFLRYWFAGNDSL